MVVSAYAGIYGPECRARATAFMESIGDMKYYSAFDISCACTGYCPSPLAPNPGAAAWLKAQLAASIVSKLPQAIKDNAIYIALTIIILAIGLTGNRLYYFILSQALFESLPKCCEYVLKLTAKVFWQGPVTTGLFARIISN